MVQKLIIMTTAINRPELHNLSIGAFYNDHYNSCINYEIYHIINIDTVRNDKLISSSDDTVNNFDKIIPENIHKIYIKTNTPSVNQAIKNIMNKIEELNLIDASNVYWWLEDDWKIGSNIKFFDRIKNLLIFNTCGITMTSKCPIGSFRGGPIMNGNYFIKYFNLVKIGIHSDSRNIERQYFNYMRGIKCVFRNKSYTIHRKLHNETDKQINILLIYYDVHITKINKDFCHDHYSANFNSEIFFNYYVILINNDNYDSIYLLKCDNNIDVNSYDNYTMTNIHSLLNMLNTDSITYVTIKKYVVDDLGRSYMSNLFNNV